MKINFIKFSVFTLVFGIFLVGCNGTSSTDETIEDVGEIMSNATHGEETHVKDENAEKPLLANTVVIKQMKYFPETITVKKGDTITFINQDMVPHDVTQTDSNWQSPLLEVGDSWQLVPEKSDDYFCSIHLVMKGSIVVEE